MESLNIYINTLINLLIQKESNYMKTKISSENLLKHVLKGFSIAFFGIILGNFLSFITRILIARELGAHLYGAVSIGLGITSILVIISLLGLNPGISRYVSYYTSYKKRRDAIATSLKICLISSVTLSTVIFLFADKIAINIFHEPDLITVIKIFSFTVPFLTLTSIFFSILLGFKLVKYKVIINDISKNLSILLFLVTFFYFTKTLLSVLLAFLAGAIFSFLVGIFYFKTKADRYLQNILYQTRINLDLLKFSFPLLFSNLSSFIVSWSDVLMLGYFSTTFVVGGYTAALNVCVILQAFLPAVSLVIIPIISNLYSQRMINSIKNIYESVTRWIFAINFPIFFIVLNFPKIVIKILFGAEYTFGTLILKILIIGFFLHTLFGLSYPIIIAIGDSKVRFYLSLIVAALNIILNLILIPPFGGIGPAISLTVSVSLGAILGFIYLYKKIKFSPFNKLNLVPIISTMIAFILVKLVVNILELELNYNFSHFLFLLTIFSILYFFTFFIFRGATSEDIELLKVITKKITTK